MIVLVALWVVVVGLFVPVYAQEREAPPPDAAEVAAEPAAAATPSAEWKATAGLNAVLNTGNSSNQTLGVNAMTSYKREKNKITWTAAGAYGRARDNSTGNTTTNTKNWKTDLRYDRFITGPFSVFGLGHIDSDKPAGFDLRYGGSVGVSHEIWKSDPNLFKYETGFNYTREDRTPPPNDDVFSVRFFLQYKRKISDWASLGQDVESLFNVEEGKDVRLNTLTALTVKLTDKLALKAGYSVRFDNVPVTGKKKTDTITQLGLVVDFI